MPLPALAGAAPQHDVTEVDISDFWVWNQCTGEWIWVAPDFSTT